MSERSSWCGSTRLNYFFFFVCTFFPFPLDIQEDLPWTCLCGSVQNFFFTMPDLRGTDLLPGPTSKKRRYFLSLSRREPHLSACSGSVPLEVQPCVADAVDAALREVTKPEEFHAVRNKFADCGRCRSCGAVGGAEPKTPPPMQPSRPYQQLQQPQQQQAQQQQAHKTPPQPDSGVSSPWAQILDCDSRNSSASVQSQHGRTRKSSSHSPTPVHSLSAAAAFGQPPPSAPPDMAPYVNSAFNLPTYQNPPPTISPPVPPMITPPLNVPSTSDSHGSVPLGGGGFFVPQHQQQQSVLCDRATPSAGIMDQDLNLSLFQDVLGEWGASRDMQVRYCPTFWPFIWSFFKFLLQIFNQDQVPSGPIILQQNPASNEPQLTPPTPQEMEAGIPRMPHQQQHRVEESPTWHLEQPYQVSRIRCFSHTMLYRHIFVTER